MTSTQYRSALDRLKLTQAQAAKFLGFSIRTSHGWANGKPIPEVVAKLLNLMIRLEIAHDKVELWVSEDLAAGPP